MANNDDWLYVPGRIIRLFCNFTKPPKEKYVVIVAVKPCLIGFLINTHLTTLQQSRQDLMDEQIKVSGADYQFLTHASYLDCTQPEDLDEEDVSAQIAADPTRDLKMISEKTRNQIGGIVTNSLTIESGLVKIILKNLIAH